MSLEQRLFGVKGGAHGFFLSNVIFIRSSPVKDPEKELIDPEILKKSLFYKIRLFAATLFYTLTTVSF